MPTLSEDKIDRLNNLTKTKVNSTNDSFIICELNQKEEEDEESENDPNGSSGKKNSFLNNMSVSQILSDEIDNMKPEISLQKQVPLAKKIIQKFIYNPSEKEVENENIIYYTTGEGKKNLSFISLSLLMNSFIKATAYDYPIPSLLKCLMEQKTSLFSTDVIFDMFNSYFDKNPSENIINLLNYYIINNYANDIANNIALKGKIVKTYEEIQKEMQTIPFGFKNINVKDIIKLFQTKDSLKIYYNLRQYVGLVPYHYSTPSYVPYFPLALPVSFSIFDWNIIEIARQMSIITQHLYFKIENSEFCNSNWMKGDKEKNAPNITQLINRFNQMSYWISEEILAYDRAQDRARVIEKFITLANELRKMNNFNDCYNIINAFNFFPLKRLTKTWGRIKIEYINVLKEINDLCSLGSNFANLRSEYEQFKIKEKTTGCVPYLGLFLKKLAFFDEGPKYFKDELINLDKVMKIGEVFAEIKYFQQFTYNYQPVFALAFIADPKTLDEKQILELSNKLEPKFLLSKRKQKMKKRKTTSDSCYENKYNTFGKNFLQYLKDTSEQSAKTVHLKDKLQFLKNEMKTKQMNVN